MDDLAKGSDPSIEQERTKLMANVLRYAANDNCRTKRNDRHDAVSQRCQAGVVFTGEVALHAASDVTRVIHIRLPSPMRDGVLDERACAATVFRAWMQWLLPQFDQQMGQLRGLLDRRYSNDLDARLSVTVRLLYWALELLIQFAFEQGVVDSRFQADALKRIYRILIDIASDQSRLVQKTTALSPRGNLSWYILKAYRENQFHVVDKQRISCKCEDCIFDKGALCIRTGVLLDYLRTSTPYQGITEKRMTRRLREEGLLSPGAEKRSAEKKIHGRRYLKLPLEDLKRCSVAY